MPSFDGRAVIGMPWVGAVGATVWAITGARTTRRFGASSVGGFTVVARGFSAEGIGGLGACGWGATGKREPRRSRT